MVPPPIPLDPRERLRALIKQQSDARQRRSFSGGGATKQGVQPQQRPQGNGMPETQLPFTFESPVKTRNWAPAHKPTSAVVMPTAQIPIAFSTPAKPKKPRKQKTVQIPADVKAQKALMLRDPELALLCVPSSFMDCRQALRSTQHLDDDVPSLLWLTKTGNIWGYDGQKREICPPANMTLYDAPWPRYWEHIKQVRIELVDESGNKLYMSEFAAWSVRTQSQTGNVLVHTSLRTMGNKRFLTHTEQIPPEAAWRVYPRYVTPGSSTSEAGVRQLVERALENPDSPHLCLHELVRQTLLSQPQMIEIARRAVCSAPVEGIREQPVKNPPVPEFNCIAELLIAMHKPKTPEEGYAATQAARAIAISGVCHVAKHNNERPPHVKSALPILPSTVQRLIASQPETLTSDQTEVITKICDALQRPTPLNALISGDVGTGKTLTFAIPCMAAHMSGSRVAIISPTEILANQVFENLKRRFPDARIERVLTGKKIIDDKAVLIGTAGLTSVAAKQGYLPDFVIVDEQHKLSTEVRAALCQPWTHLIEASATPIPRSLASSLFAGMEVFNLYTAPVKRDIKSSLLGENQRSEIVTILRQVVDSGDRAAFIYPLVQSDTKSTLGSVMNAATVFEERFPGKVGTLHGKMKPAELIDSLSAFRSGDKPIMVASTVMETGIDVPDIRLLVVREADRFGAAQLHQLRGREARNGGKAQFIMLVKDLAKLAPESLDRLQMVRDTNDGYALSEADMRQRGFGDLTGDAQSGNVISPFRLLGLSLDDFSSQ